MKEWKQVKVCPVCGGRLVVSDFYSLSRDYQDYEKGRVEQEVLYIGPRSARLHDGQAALIVTPRGTQIMLQLMPIAPFG